MPDITSQIAEELETQFRTWGQPAYRVAQLLEWLYVHRAATWEAIGPWVKYTHVKDSRLDPAHPDGYQLCLTGAGDLPLPEIIRVLQAGGYDGWLTLEWEKKWHPELEAPEVAFPGYVKYMRGLL